MAERRIEELPSVVDPSGENSFPVEQGGVAKRMSLQDMRDYVFERGADTVTVTANMVQNKASMTASEIYEQVSLTRNVVLRYENTTGIVQYATLYLSSPSYCVFHSPGSNATTVYQVDDNGDVTTDEFLFVRTNATDTIGGNGRLNLNYTPSSGLHAVNKDYVDTAVSGVTGSVTSVNGQIGDVVIPDVLLSSNRQKTYTNYSISYGNSSLLITVPNETSPVFQFSYLHDSGIADVDYAAIGNALSGGQVVVCNIVSGASNFKAYLTRYCEGQSEEESYFSFDFVTAQTTGSNLGLWYGSLKVYGDDTIEYKEGTITHQESQS